MSKIVDLLDGKISHQKTAGKPEDDYLPRCAKCGSLVSNPGRSVLKGFNMPTPDGDGPVKRSAYQMVFHYVSMPEDFRDCYIYPTKRGISVVYCSDYCRKKHSHRFQK